MAEFTDILKGLDIAQLVAIGGIVWFFASGIHAKIDKLDEKVNQIDKRLVAVETLLSVKGCCVLKDTENVKKAE
jgi:hypothetical protein